MKNLTRLIAITILAMLVLVFATKAAVAGDMEKNKAAIKRAIEALNSKDKAGYLDLYDAKCVMYGLPPGLPPDIEGIKQFVTMRWAAFPDEHVVIEDMVAEGDKVAGRYTLHATHQGDFMGVPATGKKVTMVGNTILRFANGKCVERWNNADQLGLMQQLGVIPKEEPAGESASKPHSPEKSAQPMMKGKSTSAEQNKAIARRYVEEAINKGNLAALDEVIDATYVYHEPGTPETHGPEGLKQLIMMYRNAFPDLHIAVEDMVAEGDKVVARGTAHGTHKGELMGTPPTGKQVAVTTITVLRFAGGKVAEEWEVYDALGMMQQLGLAPMPGPQK
jgi:steroid delta-isomerase-like uncharacterized protein